MTYHLTYTNSTHPHFIITVSSNVADVHVCVHVCPVGVLFIIAAGLSFALCISVVVARRILNPKVSDIYALTLEA